MNELIIDHPEWQTPKQRYVIGMVTLGFWMVWIYLWIPLLSLLAWVFGFQVFERHMIELKGYQGLFDLLGVYAIVVFLLGGSLLAWAGYNIRRYGGENRRSVKPVVTLEEQARTSNVASSDLERWQKSQMIVIEHGHIRALHSHGGEGAQRTGSAIFNWSGEREGQVAQRLCPSVL